MNTTNKSTAILPIANYWTSLEVGTEDINYSTGCTDSASFKNESWSTCCTIDGKEVSLTLVSKSIDTKKDVQMTEKTVDTRPAHIYFRRITEDKDFCDPEFAKNAPHEPVKVLFCGSWSQLVDMLKMKPKTICVNAEELQYTSCIEIVNMINTLAKLASIEKITITLGINKTTTMQQVKEAQKSEMFGLVPASEDFDFEETSRALTAQWNQIPYWPKHIIDQLPGAKKPQIKKPGEIKLTPRQEQILDLIRERGASNKTIAKTLNIAESTVKLHVGIVLKKFGVKNRTQLALFGKK